MSINLSDLTSPNNQDVLAEITSGADFLDPIGKLKNLSRSQNSGSDALQTVALNQPKALPLIKNPAGNLGGYLYIPNVTGNYATGPSVTIGSNQTWQGELDMVVTQFGNYIVPMGGGDWTAGFGLIFYSTGNVRLFCKGNGGNAVSSGVTFGTPFNAKYGFDGTNLYVDINDTRVYTTTAPSQASSITHPLQLNQQNNLTRQGNYAIQKAKLTVNNAVVFDCDFNGSTSIRHGDTKFNCVGGPVSLTRTGNDPVTVVKKDILRFANKSDGSTTIGLDGLFSQEFNGGYMFAALSVLGDGGGSYGYVFATNKTGGDSGSNGGVVLSYRHALSNNLGAYRGALLRHYNLFDDSNGDILHEHRATNAASLSKVNNADEVTLGNTYVIESDEFKIGKAPTTTNHAAFDLEFLALFSADSVPDEATASKIRDYINKRNQIYLRHQTDGFYFFDPQKLAAGDVTSWNGNITGSDLGDTDVATNVTIVQGSQTSQPNADGYSLTFEDNTQHLEWASAYTPNFPAGQTKAWQIVGTSLGTFAYLTQGAVTELNLLGNFGNAFNRKAGDLYGIILLPESATGADIESARRLLIDRGGADASTFTDVQAAWVSRSDIVEFRNTEFPLATALAYAWENCNNMTTIGPVNAPLSNSFTSAWKDCSALTSFPAGAKLGTEATGSVNFTSAWQASGLTSFPDLDLSNGNTFTNAWRDSSLSSFGSNTQLGTNSQNVDFVNAWFNTGLTSFPALDLSNGINFSAAFYSTPNLTSFPAGAKLGTSASNVNFSNAWRASGLTSFSTPLPTATTLGSAFRYCYSLSSFNLDEIPLATHINTAFQGNVITSFNTKLPKVKYAYAAWYACTALTDFSADVFTNWNPSSISTGVFNDTWGGCTSLTAQSVENILQSIDASNQHGTDDGTSTGNPLGDSGIDIDYNVATGSLSAATNSAIDSLSGKGWEVFINGVLVIPNILDLAPAAAYSLRSFDADADPNVVNVRRSSDSATSDFKASEVSDGTLRDWTLGDTLALDGQRMYFDGADDYVDLNQSLIPATGDFSISLKYAHEEQAAINRYLLSQGNSINTFFALSINNESVLCFVGGVVAGFFGNTSISKGSIYEFKVTRVGDVFTLYVDGVSVGTQTNVGLTISTNTNTYIGQATWTTGRFTKGTAYDIKKDGTLYYKGYGNTNADWTDQVGSSNATVNGTPALFSGQGFDGHVTTWYDQSGNNNSSNQTLASSQPKIVDGGTLVTDGSGNPAIIGDGVNDTLFHPTLTQSLDNTDFLVTAAYKNSLALGVSGGVPRLYMTQGAWSYNNLSSITFSNQSGRNVLSFQTNGDAQEVFGNGTSLGTGSEAQANFAFNGFNLMQAGSGFSNGFLMEVVVFDENQVSNRTGIEKNINDTYTIY